MDASRSPSPRARRELNHHGSRSAVPHYAWVVFGRRRGWCGGDDPALGASTDPLNRCPGLPGRADAYGDVNDARAVSQLPTLAASRPTATVYCYTVPDNQRHPANQRAARLMCVDSSQYARPVKIPGLGVVRFNKAYGAPVLARSLSHVGGGQHWRGCAASGNARGGEESAVGARGPSSRSSTGGIRG